MSKEGKTFVVIMSTVVVLLGATTVFVWQSSTKQSSSVSQNVFASRADVLPFVDLSGQEVSVLGDRKDTRLLVVTTWASWCPFCADELLQFDQLSRDMGDQVRVVAINRQEGSRQANRFLSTLGELTALQLVLDPSDRFYQDIAGYTMPETIIFDQSGAVRVHHHGAGGAAVVRSHLEEGS